MAREQRGKETNMCMYMYIIYKWNIEKKNNNNRKKMKEREKVKEKKNVINNRQTITKFLSERQ